MLLQKGGEPMPDVKMIPQKLKRKRVTRVAAYTRVSTPKAEMIASLSAQVDYYSKLINSNPDWEMCGIYIDEAKTGTKDTREKFSVIPLTCYLPAGNCASTALTSSLKIRISILSAAMVS